MEIFVVAAVAGVAAVAVVRRWARRRVRDSIEAASVAPWTPRSSTGGEW